MSEMDMARPHTGGHRPQCPGALVMGANYRALGLARSLGRHGIPVWIVKQDEHVLASLSRYVRGSFPWPGRNDRSQTEYLLSLADKHQLDGALLFPTDDEGVMFIAQNHDLLSQRYLLTTQPWNALRAACDKKVLYQLGENLGIHQPLTYFPRDLVELRSLDLRFPVIVKPAMRLELNELTVDKAWLVHDRGSLLNRYSEACSILSPDLLMIQEFLPGWGESQFSYSALCDEGRPVASVTARRIRQYPMDFGRFSTFVETIEEPDVIEPAIRLLDALRYDGLVEIEFKRDPRDGRYKLLDVNPRVWGWHTLCGRAGVDFPYLLWLHMQNQPVPNVTARTGIRWVRMGADLLTALLELLRGRLPVGDYLRSIHGPLELAIFATDDPVPFFCQLPILAYVLGKRAFGARLQGSSVKASQELGFDGTTKQEWIPSSKRYK